jgi:hypothetical protein
MTDFRSRGTACTGNQIRLRIQKRLLTIGKKDNARPALAMGAIALVRIGIFSPVINLQPAAKAIPNFLRLHESILFMVGAVGRPNFFSRLDILRDTMATS